MTGTPPRAATRLLRLFLRSSAFEVVAGDLEEAYRQGRGPAWYWMQVLRSVAAHLAGLLPIAAELLITSLRQLRHQRMYVAAVCGTLALAVATVTASGVVLGRAFLDPVPYPNAERLVTLLTQVEGATSAVSAHVFQDLVQTGAPFDRLAPMRPATAAVSAEGVTTSINGTLVTPDYFELLGVRPALGHVWSQAQEPVAVVSWQFFVETLRGDPAAVGRALTVDGTSRTVIGVLPADFHPPYWVQAQIWLPLDLAPLAREPRGRRQLSVLGRLQPDASAETTAAFLATFSDSQRTRFPIEHGRQSWIARPLAEEFTSTARPALVGVAAGAGLLLLIVCANIGGLSAARALSRQSQAAIRHALGASRRRLFAEQAGESICLALIGTLGGLTLVPLLVGVAARHQRDFLERAAPLALEPRWLALGLVVGLLAGVTAALVPTRLLGDVRAGLPSGSRGATGTRRLTMTRQALVVLQVALALMLVVGAGLLVRTVQHLANVPVGFLTEGMTSVAVNMPGARFRQTPQQISVEDALIAQLSTVPGVVDVTSSIGLPAGAAMGASLHIEGRSTAEGLSEVGYTSVAPGFLTMLGVPLLAGRDISDADTATTIGAILINDTLARQYWPDGNAIGARIYLGPGRPDPGAWMEVVGIVGDVRQSLVTSEIRPTAYGSTRQYSWPRRVLTVQTPRRPATLEADLRKAVSAVDPALSVGTISYLPDVFAAQQGRHRLVMTSLALFAVVSLVLCASGLYAIVAMASRSRRREYAIRLALGAPREHVRWQVARQAGALAGLGVITGLGLAAVGVRGIAGLLSGIQPLDVTTFAAASLTLAVLAGAAAWWPAREAARVDPIETLKAE